jgi:hypothetical protein
MTDESVVDRGDGVSLDGRRVVSWQNGENLIRAEAENRGR